MEHGATLRRVDAVAAEHGIPLAFDVCRACELQQQGVGISVRPMLRPVERQSSRGDCATLNSMRLGFEQGPQRGTPDFVGVHPQIVPPLQ